MQQDKNVDKSGAILFILLCYAGPGVPVGGDAPLMLYYTNTITITITNYASSSSSLFTVLDAVAGVTLHEEAKHLA